MPFVAQQQISLHWRQEITKLLVMMEIVLHKQKNPLFSEGGNVFDIKKRLANRGTSLNGVPTPLEVVC